MPRTHALRKIIGEIGIEVPAGGSPSGLSELGGHEDVSPGVKEAEIFEDQQDSTSLQPASDQQVVPASSVSFSALTIAGAKTNEVTLACVMGQTPPARRIVLL